MMSHGVDIADAIKNISGVRTPTLLSSFSKGETSARFSYRAKNAPEPGGFSPNITIIYETSRVALVDKVLIALNSQQSKYTFEKSAI